MAARVFKLPDIDDLTKEQDAIIDLPLEGQHLVVGARYRQIRGRLNASTAVGARAAAVRVSSV